MPLQTNYRPQTLSEIIGNESVVESLQSVLTRKEDIPHVFLFTGAPGMGKTTVGMVLKNELKCSDVDFHYHNTARDRGIEVFRKILDDCQFAPLEGKIKLYLFEEAHGITGDALDSILQFLEFIPKHIYMIFCTAEPEKWQTTKAAALKRRCHSYEMKPLNPTQLNKLLNSVLQKEGVKEFPDAVINKIISVCDGSPGIALKLLDTVIDIPNDDQVLKAIEEASVSESNIAEIARVLINGKGSWQSIASMINGLSGEPESLRRAFLGYFSKVLLNSKAEKADRMAMIQLEFMEPVFNTGLSGLRLQIYLAWKASLG